MPFRYRWGAVFFFSGAPLARYIIICSHTYDPIRLTRWSLSICKCRATRPNRCNAHLHHIIYVRIAARRSPSVRLRKVQFWELVRFLQTIRYAVKRSHVVVFDSYTRYVVLFAYRTSPFAQSVSKRKRRMGRGSWTSQTFSSAVSFSFKSPSSKMADEDSIGFSCT